MSRIDKLLAELAPNGVDFRPVGELCKVLNGYAFKSSYFNTDGIGVPIIRIRDVNTGFSDTYYSGEYDERWVVGDGDIIIGMDGDFRANRWRHGRALLNQRVCRLQDFSADITPGYLFYKIQDELDRIHSSITGSTVKHLSSRELDRARIPVPPIEVQREIVRVLDQFTQLEAKLEAKLEAELEARRTQYEFYRDALFVDAGAPLVPMGKIGTFMRGRRFTKSDVVESGIPSIHYGEIYTDYGVSASRAVREVNSDMVGQLRFAKPGDVIFAGVGETVADVGKAVAWLGDTPVAVHDDAFAFTSDLNPKFVAYAVQASAFHAQKEGHVARGKVKRLSSAGLAKISIPVPSAEEQARIVSILDVFDALVNDLSSGLPAEIAARRKQYGYYRDRLLAFREAE